MRPEIEFRLLNRKCGSSCARRARSSASRWPTCDASARCATSADCSNAWARNCTASASRYASAPTLTSNVTIGVTGLEANAGSERMSHCHHARPTNAQTAAVTMAVARLVAATRSIGVPGTGIVRQMKAAESETGAAAMPSGTPNSIERTQGRSINT